MKIILTLLALLGSCRAFNPHGSTLRLSSARITRRNRVRAVAADVAVAAGGSLQEQGRALAERLSGVPVYLVGMMGSGKSTVGGIFCKALGSYSFLETDSLIERAVGSTVTEIFESSGEDDFRAIETAVLTQVSSFVRVVVSTGGGIVTVDSNWGKLQSGVVVFLDVPCDVLAKRMISSSARGDEVATRPLLAGLDDPTDPAQVSGRLQDLLDERIGKYNQADLVVKFDGSEALDDCALKIISKLDAFIEGNPPKWKQWKDKAKLPAK